MMILSRPSPFQRIMSHLRSSLLGVMIFVDGGEGLE